MSRRPEGEVPATSNGDTTLIKEAHVMARFCSNTVFSMNEMNLMVQLNGIAVDEMQAELCKD